MIDADTKTKLERLVQLLAPGAKLARAWPLEGGISATMIGLEIEKPDGAREKMISRRPGEWSRAERPNAAADEFQMLQTLRRANLPVPQAIFLEAASAIFPAPSLVIEFVDAAPEYNPTDMDGYVSRFAESLFHVHQTDTGAFDFLPRTWDVRTERLRRGVDVLDEAQGEGKIRETLKTAIRSRSPGPQVLLHGDFWPGNVLWRDGELVCVVDWEDAEIGNPLWDIAVSRSELLFAFGAEAMTSFTDAYQSLSDVDFADLPFWDLCAALRPMNCFAEWAGAWPALGRFDVTEATSRARHLDFVARAMEKLDL